MVSGARVADRVITRHLISGRGGHSLGVFQKPVGKEDRQIAARHPRSLRSVGTVTGGEPHGPTCPTGPCLWLVVVSMYSVSNLGFNFVYVSSPDIWSTHDLQSGVGIILVLPM